MVLFQKSPFIEISIHRRKQYVPLPRSNTNASATVSSERLKANNYTERTLTSGCIPGWPFTCVTYLVAYRLLLLAPNLLYL